MPLYAYHCNDCGSEFELLVRSSDVPACPQCQSANLQQLVSKICVEIKYPAIAQSWRRQAQKEGDLSNFSGTEINAKKKS
ncbi:FmdB family zinc ribbon protein [Beijerinckia indica]|uniref:Regulatory protein, FmdB family n=1 Tax=Beijerinckia indica subsp. indica (strain ATCC 9039 / DSM 1715 / NCIMB 8712) TaxID=395963 RepID=B2IJG5_BEII9|nr:zinc ribbon domain-containing protein [Beijerinckia indica]ACB96278.1 regulatory protein, FmdB family [Beijerinckia indica subsp. indica ATCC 9039]